ncbi:hypothetical protein [uncultured Neglectibacter sp.]|uniref:hypothetical protein n=1 Tax=uncultured Neglectibacter sp. TaxID=1924108 RepID=UPI0034DE51AB
MKKLLSILLCICLLGTFLTVSAAAQEEVPQAPKTTIEYFSNGDYFITVVTQDAPVGRSTDTSGSKTGTYYTASGTAVWDVTVYGTFSYTRGVTSTANSASATVYIADSSAKFISKNAYTSGASAYATATVSYKSLSTTKTVVLTCDKYGNLY